MPDIILLTGNVDYAITLDPGAWLFDDRKFDLNEYFEHPHELDEPPRKFKKRDLLKENRYSFAVPLKPYLLNAEPKAGAETVVIETKNGERHEIPFSAAESGILAFAKDGRFLTDNGPAHFYHGDGSNKDQPITEITKLIVR
ncbi:MAG TPA: peptidyl-prolyl cis-trans isomerase [Bacillales bacterium]|nr:peptidyl-prolyl cis-trans isomerase [Bacillales bacterium]